MCAAVSFRKHGIFAFVPRDCSDRIRVFQMPRIRAAAHEKRCCVRLPGNGAVDIQNFHRCFAVHIQQEAVRGTYILHFPMVGRMLFDCCKHVLTGRRVSEAHVKAERQLAAFGTHNAVCRSKRANAGSVSGTPSDAPLQSASSAEMRPKTARSFSHKLWHFPRTSAKMSSALTPSAGCAAWRQRRVAVTVIRSPALSTVMRSSSAVMRISSSQSPGLSAICASTWSSTILTALPPVISMTSRKAVLLVRYSRRMLFRHS